MSTGPPQPRQWLRLPRSDGTGTHSSVTHAGQNRDLGQRDRRPGQRLTRGDGVVLSGAAQVLDGVSEVEGALLGGADLGCVVDMDDAEALVVAVGPFEVV